MKNKLFEYKALTPKGEMTEGHIKGTSDAEVILALRNLGLYPTQIRVVKDNPFDDKPIQKGKQVKPPQESKRRFTPTVAFVTGLITGALATYITFLLLFA